MNALTVAARAVCRAYHLDREPLPSEGSDLAEALAAHDRRSSIRERTYQHLQSQAGIAHPHGSRAPTIRRPGR